MVNIVPYHQRREEKATVFMVSEGKFWFYCKQEVKKKTEKKI